MSKSLASFGVNQIIKTEKNAAQKIEEARHRRILRLKQAETEAKQEVQQLRIVREKQFEAFKDTANSVNKDAELRVETAVRTAMAEMEEKAEINRSKVIQDILQLVCDVKPEIHPNYTFSKNKNKDFIPPVDAFAYNVRTSFSEVTSKAHATDQYEVDGPQSKKDDEIKPYRHRDSLNVNTDLCNLCNPETRIEDGLVCTSCNPNAAFGDDKELLEWKCPGILCEGGDNTSEIEETVYRAETTYQRTPFTDIQSFSDETENSYTEKSTSNETNEENIITDEYIDENENYRHTKNSTTDEYHESSHGDKQKIIETVKESNDETILIKSSVDDNLMHNEDLNHIYPTLDLSESNPTEETTIIIEIPRIGDNFQASLPWNKNKTHCRKCMRNTRNITINLNSMKTSDSPEPNSTQIIEPPSQIIDDTATVVSSELNVPRSVESQVPTTLSTTTFNTSTNEDNDSLYEPEF